MPHATTPAPGFQAFILCGPGASLDTFTSDPVTFPKALIPIANRPMVWYALDYCYRMGISSITLITPPESRDAIQAALDTNPYLTSLPSPKSDLLAPEGLDFTSGTAEIFRFPEVHDAITQDFIVLPCDIVADLDGLSLLDAWIVAQSGFGGATGGLSEDGRPIPMGIGGEKAGRRGGLSVWYYAARSEDGKKKIEEADFLATTPFEKGIVPPPEGSLRNRLEKVVISMPMDTLNDVLDEEKTLSIRGALIKKHGRIKMRTNLRDAHVYVFPYWVKEFMARNESFDSLSEDVLGWWAKATWQDGLADKLGLRQILDPPREEHSDGNADANPLSEEISIMALSTTSRYRIGTTKADTSDTPAQLASRVQNSGFPFPAASTLQPEAKLTIPPLLAYIHPSPSSLVTTTSPFPPPLPTMSRVDTSASLLATSLRLAKLPQSSTPTSASTDVSSASPLCHAYKIAEPDSLPPQSRISAEDSLIDTAVTLSPRITIKESIIGSRCVIGTGARLTRCLLMEGVEVGEGVQLTGCIVGSGAKIEGPLQLSLGEGSGAQGKKKASEQQERTVLWDCEVGHGFVVPWGTEARGEKFVLGAGILDEAMEGEDGGPGSEEDITTGDESELVSQR